MKETIATTSRVTLAVIVLCGTMTVAETVGGLMSGSVALMAGGLCMAMHAGALLAGVMTTAYTRRHATDARFSFGTGKLADLANFTGAVVLATMALLIICEALRRLVHPVAIDMAQALPVAMIGLGITIASAWWLRNGMRRWRHGARSRNGAAEAGAGVRRIETAWGALSLEVFGNGASARFRLRSGTQGMAAVAADWHNVFIETERPDGRRDQFRFNHCGHFLESRDEIAMPHEFVARLRLSREGRQEDYVVDFEAHDAAVLPRRTGRRQGVGHVLATLAHVLTATAVPLLVSGGLMLTAVFDEMWIDAMAGLVSAMVMSKSAFRLIRATGAILLDMSVDETLAASIRDAVEVNGDRLADLHLWRLGTGRLGAIVSVATDTPHENSYYRARLSRIDSLSHLTLEIRPHPAFHGTEQVLN